MAALWRSGFELNSASIEFTNQSGAAATIQTTVVNSGTYAGKIASLTSATRAGWLMQAVAASQGHTRWRVNQRVDTLPSAENRVIILGSGTATIAGLAEDYYITLGSDGKYRLYDSNVPASPVVSSAITANDTVWHRVEVNLDDPAMTLYLDGVSQGSIANVTAGLPIHLAVGGNLNGEAQTTGLWYFDDLGVNDNSGTVQTGLPGAGSIVHQYPDSAGDFTEGSAGGSSPATGWDNVDEAPPNDAVDYWVLATQSANSTSADRLDVNCGAFLPSAASITAVMVGIRMQPASNASCSYATRIKSQASGTLLESASIAVTGTAFVTQDDTAPRQYKLVSYTDPQGGGAWTAALLGTMQIGVRGPDTTPNPRITALWALVEYVPATSSVFPDSWQFFHPQPSRTPCEIVAY